MKSVQICLEVLKVIGNVCVLQVSHREGESCLVRRASSVGTNLGVHSKSLGYRLGTNLGVHS